MAAPIAFAVGAAAAAEASRPADKPLVVNGDLSLTTLDFDAYMERVPADRRSEFRAEYEKINPTVDGLWLRRVLASRARAQGLDKDPIVAARLRQAQEDILTDVYLKDFASKVKMPNLEARARERYLAHQKDFQQPELLNVQHILVSTKTYPKAVAKARAEEVYRRAMAGESFGMLADEYTDNKASKELKAVPLSAFAPPLPEAVSKLKVAGEIMPPTESQYGFHIIKFESRMPARTKTFDEVKEDLIAIEKGKILDDARTAHVEAVRADPKTTLYVENVRGLKSDFKIDAETLKNSTTRVQK